MTDRGRAYLILAASLLLPTVANAAELAINPSSVAADYTGAITLNVSGLANGQTVRFESFLDLDGDGRIDAGEMLIQSFEVTDGAVLRIGGVRNINVPGDEDGAANGQIRAAFDFRILPELNRAVAKQVYKVSPVTGSFSPLTAAFATTQPPYAQQVIGQVRSGGAGVPYAFAALIGPDSGPLAIALADATGHFTLNCPAGTFELLALKTGFLVNLADAPQVTIAAGATVSRDLSLIAADRTISGRLTDGGKSGVPGVQITTAADDPGFFTAVFSDSNSDFALPVSSAAAAWELIPSSHSAALLGLLVASDRYVVDTGGGNLSGVSIQFPSATALIHGTVLDDQGHPVTHLRFAADNEAYDGIGVSDSVGNYAIGVLAGNWNVNLDADDPAALGYVSTSVNVNVSTGQAVRQDLVLRRLSSAHLRGHATDDVGTPLANLEVRAGNVSTRTGVDGSFDLGVSGGSWYVRANPSELQQRGLVGNQLHETLNDGEERSGLRLVARPITAQITGHVRNSSGAPLGDVTLHAYITIGDLVYDLDTRTDSAGIFSISVFDATWRLNVECAELNARGYDCVDNQFIPISGVNAEANFVAAPTGVATPTPTTTPSRTATPTPTPTPGACVGDCSEDGTVTIDELVQGVNIALGVAGIDQCLPFDCNGTGSVTVDCLVRAVNSALFRCVGE